MESIRRENVLGYFDSDYFLTIDRLVKASFSRAQPRLADSDYIGFIVHICITMQRTEARFLMEEAIEVTNELTHEYNLIKKICIGLEEIVFSINAIKKIQSI